MATEHPTSSEISRRPGGSSQVRRLILCLLVLAFLGSWAQAQTPLSGNVYDGNGGPLVSGTVYHASGAITVPAGQTLTIPEDVVVKFSHGGSMYVIGTLTVLGTAGDPVAFTSLLDDDWGGDTNGDGPSTGFYSYWRGIDFAATAAASSLEQAVLRWAGEAFWGALDIHAADISVTDCTFIDNSQSAIDLNNSGARPTVTGCSFIGNLRYVCTSMNMEAVPGFSNCTASDNGGNCLDVTNVIPATDLMITADNCVGGALLLHGQPLIAAGITLTLGKGVVVKLWNGGYLFTVQGTLLANGTVDEPVVFTAYADDERGGDSNGDGVSNGWLNYWGGMIFNSTAGDSVLENSVVRYAGYGYYDAITLQGCDVTLRGCVLEYNGQEGLGLAGAIAHPTVEWCRFENNGKYAVSDVPIESVPGFRFNRAEGNMLGDYIRITKTSPTEDVVLHPYNSLNGVHAFASHTIIPAGVSLDLAAGTIIKNMRGGGDGIEVHGSFNLRGTAREPVVITSYRDDLWGGDTNADGPSTGSWIDWSGIKYHADAETSIMEHAVVSYSGYGYWNAVNVASPNVTLRSVLAEQNYTRGFSISALAGNAENLIARSCQYAGIQVTAGSFDLVNCTALLSGAGIEKTGAYTGTVRNCIAWDNTNYNYNGFAAGELQYCNGSAAHAGANGCINVDPQFVDAVNGDYRLALTSPCVDTAEYAAALPLACDFAENSRILDPNLTGTMLPDMGALEHTLWTMTASGRPEVGGALRFQVDGPAGSSAYMFGLLDGAVASAPYGVIAAGNASLMSFATVSVGTDYVLKIPRLPSVIGAEFGVQTISWPAGTPAVGGVTNLYRTAIEPSFNCPLVQKR